MSETEYKAFITYSHKDTKAATWLTRALESYRVPSRLVGKKTSQGIIPRRLGSIFRDREELPAGGNLSHTLNSALARSEYLIVVCSPAARQSRWVDLEITEFKKTHADSKILCFIVGGEPYSTNDPASQHQECFPKALEFLERDARGEVAAEPIAADGRAGGDGKRLAKLKISAGLLGLGLDELIQRDGQRRHRNLLLMTLASATGMLAMAMLSFIAIDARNNEELRRAEAEDLIEFMLSDLRDGLDAVGRLDVLDAVGEKAIEYYSKVELKEHSESSLGRRARAFHLLGEVDELLGDLASARARFSDAYESTGELLARSPDDGNRIYNHAQSVYWLGYLDSRLGNFESTHSAFEKYLNLAEQLVALDPENMDWLTELANANLNLGYYISTTGSSGDTISYFNTALESYQIAAESQPGNIDALWLIAQAHAYLADAYESGGLFNDAKDERRAEMEIYKSCLAINPRHQDINLSLITALDAVSMILVQQGQVGPAIAELIKAKRLADELVELDAENTFTTQSLVSVLLDLGSAHSYVGDLAASQFVLDEAGRLLGNLLELEDGYLEWKMQNYKLQLINAGLLGKKGQLQAALDLNERISREIEKTLNENPDVNDLNYLLAESHYLSARAYENLGLSSEAHEKAQLAIQHLLAPGVEINPSRNAILALSYALSGDSISAARIAKELRQLGFNHPLFQELQTL